MKNLNKIRLSGLNAAVEAAMREHLPQNCRITDDTDSCDLMLQGAKALPPAPAVPVLVLSTGRKQRLGALIRQIEHMLEEPALYIDNFTLGPYTFRVEEKLLSIAGKDISLTDKEVDILIYLAKQAGQAASRGDLLANVWRYQSDVDTHTVETHVYRLRQKLETGPDAESFLTTDEEGYRLRL